MPSKPKKKPAPNAKAKKPATKSHGSRGAKPRPLRLEYVTASSLTPHPANWKTHPPEQLAALRGVLSDPDVGWADAVIFNEMTGHVLDGHGRLESVGPDEIVPVLIGSWSEAAERRILLTKDPIAAMAQTQAEQLAELRDQVGELDADYFAGLSGQLDELLAGLGSATNPPEGETNGADPGISGAEDAQKTAPDDNDTPAGDGQTAPAAGGAEPELTRLVVITCRDEMHQEDLLDAMDRRDGSRIAALLEGVDFVARNG
jgi:hypothetical protein